MDFAPIIQELGGGLAAVVIVILGWVAWQLWKRSNEVADRELASTREFAKEFAEVVRDNTTKLDGLIRVLEGRNNAR